MSWTKKTVSSYLDVPETIRDYALKTVFAGTVTVGGSNTGDGQFLGQCATEDAVAETWTITCTAVTGGSPAAFSVTGSVSGAQTSANTDELYENSLISFVIFEGDTAWAVGDTFSFSVASDDARWEEVESDFASAQRYTILKGLGDGTQEIYIGFRTQTNSSTYYNIEVTAFTGYVSGTAYDNQPGYKSFYCCCINAPFEMRIFLNSRKIFIVPRPGTSDECGYAGWFLQAATESQYGYPMFTGGTSRSASTLLTDSSASTHRSFWAVDYSVNVYFGAVYDGEAYINVPFAFPKLADVAEDYLTGNRIVHEAYFRDDAGDDLMYGHWDGLYFISNQDSSVTSDDLVVRDGYGYLCIQETQRVGAGNTLAVYLEED